MIKDEFTNLPMTKQRRYQLRHKRDRLCALCPKKAVGKKQVYCLEHLVAARERQRETVGSVRRYKTRQSYRMEEAKK